MEIKSVNHRFLKLHVKLPVQLLAFESDVENAIRRGLSRGSVSLSVRLENTETEPPLGLNVDAARRYVEAANGLAKELQLSSAEISMDTLLRMPGVLESQATAADEVDPKATRTSLLGAVDEALSSLDQARRGEGEKLQEVFLAHMQRVGELLASVAQRAPEVPIELRDKTLLRVNGLLQTAGTSLAIDESALLRELCTLADRTDITEELNRAQVHLTRLKTIIEEDGETGRRFEFLLQELQREVNTIGSKANDTSIAHAVVEMKVEVERMKEQVQNLE
jgi:uncharacterized protein (TIGR00255 family)